MSGVTFMALLRRDLLLIFRQGGDALITLAFYLLAVMTIPTHDARAIFDRAVEHTRGLSPATFDQWFGGVQYDDLTDGVLTLRVQNEFVLEWVKANFLLQKIAEKEGIKVSQEEVARRAQEAWSASAVARLLRDAYAVAASMTE